MRRRCFFLERQHIDVIFPGRIARNLRTYLTNRLEVCGRVDRIVKNDEEVVKLNGRKSLLSKLIFKLRRPARPDKRKPYDDGLAKGGNNDTINS